MIAVAVVVVLIGRRHRRVPTGFAAQPDRAQQCSAADLFGADPGGRAAHAQATHRASAVPGIDRRPVPADTGPQRGLPAGPVERGRPRRPPRGGWPSPAAPLTGFFGVGGGFVIMPVLVLALGDDMPVAVGTSLLVIATSSAEGVGVSPSKGGHRLAGGDPVHRCPDSGRTDRGSDRRPTVGGAAEQMVCLAARHRGRLHRGAVGDGQMITHPGWRAAPHVQIDRGSWRWPR